MTEPDPNKKKHLFDDPKNVKNLIRFFLVGCVIIFFLDVVFFLSAGHKHLAFEDPQTHENVFPSEGWFSFYPLFGFAAYTMLVLISKQLRKVLMRPEDYYDR